MSDTWDKEPCPECGRDNWVCHGDLSDLTAPDREGCECWGCGHVWLFDYVEGVELPDAFIEAGRKRPT